MTNRRLHRYRDRDQLATAVAKRLVDSLIEIQARQPLAQLCLCGGEVALAVYGELARLAPDSPVDLPRLELWWSDEYYTATGEGERNAGQLLSVLRRSMPLVPARTHAMPARTNVDAADAALQYGAELGQTRFDLCLLSLGVRGEVAAITDGMSNETSPVVATGSTAAERLTITYPTINRSSEVWVIASGDTRAAAVAAALAPESTMPASRVGGRRATRWFIDAAAAAGLPTHRCAW